MVRKIKIRLIFGILICISALYGCGKSDVKEAVFTNLKPSITFDNQEYIITKETIAQDYLEGQIARVTKVNNIISYSDESNPYKKIGKIYKVKNESIDKIVAIELNDTIYIAEVN